MLNLVSKLVYICTQQVRKYGAQYYTFAIVSLINHPIAYFYEFYNNPLYETTYIRTISIIMCLGLLFKEKWPTKLKIYLPLFWYLTIIISLPGLTTILLLKNKISFSLLMNFNIGIMVAILLLDSISFLVVEIIGITVFALFFFLFGGTIHYIASEEEFNLFLYILLCILILGTIFTRNKEIYNHYTQQNKDNLNKALENKVLERTKELEIALTTKNELLNNLSHEVRTPVHGFTIISEGLVEQWHVLDESKKLRYATNIAQNASRLEKLISQLLDLSKYNANKMVMNFKRMDLNDSIKLIINECNRLYLFNRTIDIHFTSDNDKLEIIGDKEKLEQVLRNLLFNAIKFTHDGGIITIYSNIINQELYCSISDTGIGIPNDELISIFEAFSQSSRTKTGAGGTGLGLSISKNIIKEHNGHIWAENNKDSGSIFKFTIPIKQP